LARAPELGQQEAIIAIDHVDIDVEQFLLGDMVLIDIHDLEPVHILQGARCLGQTQIAAIAERGRDIAMTG
jgi:hypothetical protein